MVHSRQTIGVLCLLVLYQLSVQVKAQMNSSVGKIISDIMPATMTTEDTMFSRNSLEDDTNLTFTFFSNVTTISDNSSSEGGYLPEEFTVLSERSKNCVVAYSAIFLVAAFANLTVLLSVCQQLDKLKWRITVLILHLAIADLIVTFFVIPMEVFWRLTIGWIGGNTLCKICQFLRAFGLYLSSNILICISIDRFFAIIFPLRMAGAAKRVKTMIVFAWVTAALSSLPQVIRVVLTLTLSNPLIVYAHLNIS